MFIARAVRTNGPLGVVEGCCVYTAVPELSDLAHGKMFLDHLANFQKSPGHIVDIEDDGKPFHHELRHNAESAFWMLAWWAVHAFPEGGTDVTQIPGNLYRFTSGLQRT